MQPRPLAKLIALAGCVSLVAALILTALPDFQREIVSFPVRVGIFLARYSIPIVLFQMVVFLVLFFIKRP
jgi:hypothetical protein